MTRLGLVGAVLVGLTLASSEGTAQVDKPRFVFILDNSSTMASNVAGMGTHGDGSESQPGCDLDGISTGGWKYDDSKLFQAKSAIIDTISAFGSAEFALATYARVLLGQPCQTDGDCTAIAAGTSCMDLPDDATTQKYCVRHMGDTYLECSSGASCTGCATPTDTNDRIFEWSPLGCSGAQVIVGFPSNGYNYPDIYHWIDGKEDLPPFTAASNREIRAETPKTPLAGSVYSVRDWLLNPSRIDVGASAGLLSSDSAARDPRAACRPYSIILVTDGEDTCAADPSNDPVKAAGDTYSSGITVYVVGLGTGSSDSLSRMALAGSGGKKSVYLANNRADLAASLGDIIVNSVPVPRCNCSATCYDEAAAFPKKGQPCSVGVGACKRQGVYACNAAGDGVVCAAAAACGAAPLPAGVPSQEVCGTAPGCLAPTPGDCADENCDGQIDEGLSCDCAYQAEVCNGLDDNCNGIVDDVPAISCGVGVGECRPGTTACVDDGAGGKKTVCQGAVGPQPEICDNKDNDCDGVIDGFAQACFPASVSGCAADPATGIWTCKGICQTGMKACAAGVWQDCVGATTPQTEIPCDGKDNNCDGQIDENNPLSSTLCYPTGAVGCDLSTGKCVGVCNFGHPACQTNPITGKGELACVGAVTPTQELCNGKDDDCDGGVDEDFPNLGQVCNKGSCQGDGHYVCNALGKDVVCTVSSLDPTPEICDGIDNDCDGVVDETDDGMPGVGVSCGSAIGECRQGLSDCEAGHIVCNDVGPTPEVCNGKDDDCNGSVDDGVVPPASNCNPPGMASGAPLQGECKPGHFQCEGVDGWACVGGVGPSAEICDGKDNDCDGQIDNDADCGVAAICIDGQCAPRCKEAEQPCAADRYCENGACLLSACVLNPCPAGQRCDAKGNCYDPCATVTCLLGATCESGLCQDCYSRGCPAGQICHNRQCGPDPCNGVTCDLGQYCANGRCLQSCASLKCRKGQSCRLGQCEVDPCAEMTCPTGSYCDPSKVKCRNRICSGVSCLAGTTCVEARGEASGECEINPCEVVRCQDQEECVVQADGHAECVLLNTPNVVVAHVKPGSRGLFGCAVGGPGAGAGAETGAWMLALLVLALLKRARGGQAVLDGWLDLLRRQSAPKDMPFGKAHQSVALFGVPRADGIGGLRAPEEGRVVTGQQRPDLAADAFTLSLPLDGEFGQIGSHRLLPHQRRA